MSVRCSRASDNLIPKESQIRHDIRCWKLSQMNVFLWLREVKFGLEPLKRGPKETIVYTV